VHIDTPDKRDAHHGDYVWTVIPVQQRQAYMDTLERASSYGEIEPFASFFAKLTAEQASDPLPRPT